VPPYVLATIVLMIFAVWSDSIKLRSPFVFVGHVLLMIGLVINISDAPTGVKYFGTFLCVTGAYAAFPGVISWLSNNLSGHYKRAVGISIQVGIGNFGGAIFSNVYRTQDAPRYLLGHGTMIGFVGMGMVLLPIAVVVYTRINREREKVISRGEAIYTDKQLRELGDRAPDFKYTL